MDEEIKKAVEILRRGGIILYPTDTVWGIGCDATNAQAVQRIYDLKRSVDKRGMLVLTDKIDNVSKYVHKVPEIAWELLDVADSPLTLILPGACGVADNLIPDEKTIGIRVPKHEFCARLIFRLGRPLVSTSANVSGEPTPKTFEAISETILSGVDYIVPIQYEGTPTRTASSIVCVGEGGEIKIIRP